MSATDHWSRIDETAVQDDALWPAKMGFKSREEVIVWRRTFRRASRSFAEQRRKAPAPAVKTEAELAQLLDYLEGAPEMQQAAIEAQREAENQPRRRQPPSDWSSPRKAPSADLAGTAALAETFTHNPHRNLLLLDAMVDVVGHAIERLMLLQELDAELGDSEVAGAPDIDRMIADLAGGSRLFMAISAELTNRISEEG